jgi:hypothetical protein
MSTPPTDSASGFPNQSRWSDSSSASSSSSSSSTPSSTADEKAQIIAQLQALCPGASIEETSEGVISLTPPSITSGRSRRTINKRGKGKLISAQDYFMKKESMTPHMLGGQAILTPPGVPNMFQATGIFDLPQTLVRKTQALPKKYNSMSLASFVVFGAIQAMNQNTNLELNERDQTHFLFYKQLCFLIKSSREKVFHRNDLTALDCIIDHFRSIGNVELTSLFIEIKSYLEQLLGDQPLIKLSQTQENAWSLSFQNYDIEFLTSRKDASRIQDTQSEARLHACLLPAMLNDYGKMLKWMFEPSIYEQCKEQYRTFMTEFKAQIKNSIFTKECLANFLNSRGFDDPLELELLAFLQTNQTSAFSLYDSNFSKELVSAIEKSMILSPLPPFDPDMIFACIDEPIQRVSDLEAIYAVDILPYLEMFSKTRGKRLFETNLNQEIIELMQNRGEEYEKLYEGICHL